MGGVQGQIFFQRAARFLGQNITHSGLETGAEIRAVLHAQPAMFRHQPIPFAQKRGFQARETHIAARTIQQRTREFEAFGVAVLRLCLDRGAAGLGQAQKLGGFVEGFAGGIVDGAAKAGKFVGVFGDQELAMPA